MSGDVFVTIRIRKHGSIRSYQLGCRCDECTTVGRRRKRELDAERRKHPEDAPHGTRGGYCNWGCRCAPCKKAHAEYMKAYRGRTT